MHLQSLPSALPSARCGVGSRQPHVHLCRHSTQRSQAVLCAATVTAQPALQLQRVQLGPLTVSEVCMGTMTFGEQTDEREAHQQLSLAAESGINFLDTAEIYPVAPREETAQMTSMIIGRWFAQGGARREDWVIATKVTGRAPGLDWIPSVRTVPPGPRQAPRLDRDSIRAAAHAELRRLQTDYLDLLQLHWPERPKPVFGRHQYRPEQQAGFIGMTGGLPLVSISEQVAAVGELIREGKVRAWGLSNESTYGLVTFCHEADRQGVPRPVTVQNCFNMITRMNEGELAEAMHHLGVGLLPWSVLAGGALTGKYLAPDVPRGSRFDLFGERYARFNSDRVKAAVREYAALAQEVGLTPAQLALAFCRSRWFIPSVIVGASTVAQLRENLDTWRLTGPEGLPQEVLDRVQHIHLRNRDPTMVD